MARIGLIARADRSGLAVQTWEFWRNMRPEKTLVINPTWIGHGQALDPTMYENYMVMDSRPYPETALVKDPRIDEFLDDIDVVFTCETPYNWWIYERARQRGIKTVCQFNFEFLDAPGVHPVPDLWVAPSLWRWDDIPYRNVRYIPVPVNRSELPFCQRTELHTLLHTVGTGAIHDRNGTETLLEAMRILPSDVDVELRLRSQRPLPIRLPGRCRVVGGTADRYSDLYAGGEDVFVMPRKFGGLCLPLNEASSCGMPVVMTDLEPQNLLLPAEALVEASYALEFMAKSKIKVFESNPHALAAKITQLYREPDLVRRLSDAANQYADAISWERMRPVYQEMFESLVTT